MEDKNTDNPLDELFTETASQVDPASIAATLKPFLRINRETNHILFTQKGMRVNANNKIILFILARKAMHMQGVVDTETVTPKDIKEELGKNIPSGTIDVAIKRVTDKGLVKKTDGKYFIPDFNFPLIEEIFCKLVGE